MKMRIEVDADIEDSEIIIHCSRLTPEIVKLQNMIEQAVDASNQFVFFKGDTEYYLPLEEILFFETNANGISVHTKNDAYSTRLKLYELEEKLPGSFMRISKSAIVNCDRIYSISKNITASSLIQFQNTHKQIYVSRTYYKVLKEKLEEKRLGA